MDRSSEKKPEQSRRGVRRSSLRALWQRSGWLRLVIPLTLIVLLPLILLAIRLLPAVVPQNAPRELPISTLLDMADHHLLKTVLISGNDVFAGDRAGRQYHALKESGQTLTDLLRRDGATVTVDDGQRVSWLQGLLYLVFVSLLVGSLFLLMRRGGLGSSAFSFARSRARRFRETRPAVLFKDVAGVEEAKIELEEIVEFLKQPERFHAVGAQTPRGVLLIGSPGTGKTLLARAVAGEAGVPFYSISGSEFVEMFVGVGAARVRDLFREARAHAPCIVFIDEIDAVGRQRHASPTGGNDEREQTLNQLLVEMDGFDKESSVVVLAATNRPDVLDPALLRPGRFDRRIMLDKPDMRGRLAILEVHARGKPLAADVDLRPIARQTAGFSGADLASLLNEAALLAARRHQQVIGKAELEEAILRVMAGPERKGRVISEAEKAIIAYHEVGHAIVMRSLPGSDPVRKVTAIARGMALGITVQAPLEDRYLLRRSELLAKMAAAMGGRAAEELIFGDVTTGAGQDLEYVTDLARRMVCEFGMSALGNVALKMSEDGTSMISPEMAARIDAEVARLVEEAHATALAILREKRDKLVAIAGHLIEVETIDGEELDAMLFAA
jgi:cell division protease FtsH